MLIYIKQNICFVCEIEAKFRQLSMNIDEWQGWTYVILNAQLKEFV